MESEFKIRGYHTDMFGHVNNARYLEFLEDARWQILEDYLDVEEFLQKQLLFFVVNINISYKSQAKPNDVIRVKSGLKKIGNKSAVIQQKIINTTTGTECAAADVTFVMADADGKVLEIEGKLRQMVEQIPELKG